MIVGPIGTYFLTLNSVFKGAFAGLKGHHVTIDVLTRMAGNSTFAGATAAIMANVVLVAYIVVAMREDQSETIAAAEKEKKAR
jgi:hypothetical protein